MKHCLSISGVVLGESELCCPGNTRTHTHSHIHIHTHALKKIDTKLLFARELLILIQNIRWWDDKVAPEVHDSQTEQ